MTRRSTPFAVLAVAYLGVIGLVTVGPTLWRVRPAQSDYDVLSPATWLDPDTWVRIGSGEFIANVLLFVPLGLLLRLALPRVTSLLPFGISVALSFGIEVLQMGSPRVSDPRDVAANALGALIGVVVAAVVLTARALSRRRDARQARLTPEAG
jgi:glycopeptide antibiotics resistance protein